MSHRLALRCRSAALGGAAILALTACSGAVQPAGPVSPSPASSPPPAATPTASGTPTSTTSTPSTAPTGPGPSAVGGATPAPAWLGTRVLPVGRSGFAAAEQTPPELNPRSIVTVDELPPPVDGAFHSAVERVPPEVLARSTWTDACPVALADLRYVTVSFRGFDGRTHTGELLVNADAASAVVTVFARLFEAGFPIERMRVTSAAELNAAPTGDGNTTSAFVCRPVRGQTSWSQHAYGRAVDVNPFLNPYVKGNVVLPELATAYRDRTRGLPGMIIARGPVVRAFTAVGWSWGGDYRTLKDYMHFSATGG
jgi:hypothetical protein